ncbi:MAG: hypothetical protein CO090_08180 [Acidobacteria bacterium CG_4_9_14_3_um_filter_49_7]|nr:MAG: hypothetical protein CO090_08180 [Acidobacteria bacterium CG_4_9_14_3_um_filter_49_7]
MKCLDSVEMMELLYGEASPAALQNWRDHLVECPDCRNTYWQLNDTRDWLHKNDATDRPVVLLMAPPSVKKASFALRAAAAAIFALFLSVAGLYITHAQKQTATLLARQQQVEQKLQNAALQVQDTNRNQYMMLIALKDYLDQNYQTRKVSYEQFR